MDEMDFCVIYWSSDLALISIVLLRDLVSMDLQIPGGFLQPEAHEALHILEEDGPRFSFSREKCFSFMHYIFYM